MAANRAADLLEDHRQTIERTNEELTGRAQALIARLESLVEHVEEGYHVNSSGEVQGLGSEVDQLCRLREYQYEMLRRLERVAAAPASA